MDGHRRSTRGKSPRYAGPQSSRFRNAGFGGVSQAPPAFVPAWPPQGWTPAWSPPTFMTADFSQGWGMVLQGQPPMMCFPGCQPPYKAGRKGGGGRGGKGRGKGQAEAAQSSSDAHWSSRRPPPPDVPSSNAGSLAGRFREEVLQLRRARTEAAARAHAERLWLVLLEAEEADEVLDGGLLGMAAAQCSRLWLPDLLEAICAYAGCRLAGYGGREVAEMASAGAKLERLAASFVRAVAEYCATPPSGAFKSLRDISLAATVLFQSLRTASTPAAYYGPALRGLAELALPMLDDGVSSSSLRDAVEFLHALAHSCEANPLIGATPLYKDPVIEAALCAMLSVVRRDLHGANSFDVAMVAGAASALWSLLPHCRGSTLRPLLLDSASAARFRRTEFSVRDLALMAGAFAKTGIVSEDLAGVLNDRTQDLERINDLSNRDICFFLWAASQVESWSEEPFAVANVLEVLRRDPSAFSSHDLSTLAQALARMGDLGHAPLERVLDEAFRRQLLGFPPRDRATLMAALARTGSPRTALVRLLVRGLVGDCGELERDSQCLVLDALAQLWKTFGPQDPSPQVLADALCAAQPWVKATPSELAECAEALVTLPGPPRVDAWTSLLKEIGCMEPERLYLSDLSKLISCLVPSEQVKDGVRQADDAARLALSSLRPQRRQCFDSLVAELLRRLDAGEHLPWEQLRTLASSIGGMAASLPARIAELLSQVGTSEPCAEPAPTAGVPRTPPNPPAAWTAPGRRKEDGKDDKGGDAAKAGSTPPDGQVGASADSDTGLPAPKKTAEVVYLPDGLHNPPGLVSSWVPPTPPPASPITRLPQSPEWQHMHGNVAAYLSAMDLLPASAEDEFGTGHMCGRIGGHTHGHEYPAHARIGGLDGSPRARRASWTSGSASAVDLDWHGRGHVHDGGHGHTAGCHGCDDEACPRGSSCCAQEACCPAFRAGSLGLENSEVRLNSHCSFPGHCVQLKHTFLHIPCSLHDSDSENEDCVVCRLTRCRSSSF